MDTVLYLGGYTPDTGGSGAGIVTVRRVDGRLRVVAVTEASGPSFLAAHPRLPVLYAVHERPDGGVGAFAVDADRLTPLGGRSSGGRLPCHLAVDPAGRRLAVANYGDGTLTVHGLDADGRLDGPVWTLRSGGCGPDPERQAGPHPHQAVFTPDGLLLVVDLGTDQIRRYRIGGTVEPHPDGPVAVRPGSGPRHLTGDGAGRWYVSNELDGTVAAYRVAADGTWHETDRVPASTSTAENLPSHVELSAGYLFVGNRGPDSISVFTVEGDRLYRVGEVSSGGHWPRHFAIDGDRLYVANERSGTVAVLARRDGSGRLELTGEVLVAPSPTCVLPAVGPGRSCLL